MLLTAAIVLSAAQSMVRRVAESPWSNSRSSQSALTENNASSLMAIPLHVWGDTLFISTCTPRARPAVKTANAVAWYQPTNCGNTRTDVLYVVRCFTTMRLTDRLNNWMTDWLPDWMTDRITGWRPDWVDWSTDRPADCLTDRATYRPTGWLIDWLTGRLTDYTALNGSTIHDGVWTAAVVTSLC